MIAFPRITRGRGRTNGPASPIAIAQNFHDRVENVINVLPGRGNSGLRADDPFNAIASLIDRAPQSRMVAEAVGRPESAGGRAQIFLLPGRATDMHDAFIKRVSEFDFAELTGSGRRCEPVMLPWPNDEMSMDILLSDLGSRIKAVRNCSEGQIKEHLRKVQASHLIFTEIDYRGVALDKGQLLKNWAKFLASDDFIAPKNHYLIIFICLVFPEGLGSKSNILHPLKWLRQAWAARDLAGFMANAEKDGNITSLPELSKVSHIHMKEWVHLVERQFRNRINVHGLSDITDNLFTDRYAQIPYGEVYTFVQDFIVQRQVAGYVVET